MARFEIPAGWTVQAFRFTLEPAEQQARALARHFGARRKAFNWTVATLKADIHAWRGSGVEMARPSLRVLRKRWNIVKDEVCVTLPVIGTVRVHENTRRLQRLIGSDRARVLAISVRRNGTRLDAGVRVLIQRPPHPRVALPNSRVGVDVGVRRLATVAAAAGHVIEQVPNPRPLDAATRELRHVCRARSRCTKGSRRYREGTTEMSRLHRRVIDVDTHHLHCLTTRLAKTHGRIVVEGLDAAGMLRQQGLPGARARRRGLCDAVLGTPRRHLSYKTGWYGSQMVVADRWFPSSKTCHACGHVQNIGWDEKWQCDGCWVIHQRDDNAAVNLARYEETVSVVGPVGAAVKRGADRKTGPGRAGGCEAWKGRSRTAAEQPRDGVQVA